MGEKYFIWSSDTFPKQGLAAEVVDDGKEDDDPEGDEEEFEDGVHPSPLTANLVSEGCFFYCD